MANPRYYVTAPVFDAAAGRIEYLYSAVLCDAVARHRRSCGFDAAFCAGTASPDQEAASAAAGQERSAGRPDARRSRTCSSLAGLAALAELRYTHSDILSSEGHIRAVHSLLRRTMRRSHRAIYKANYQGRWCPHDNLDVSPSAAPAQCPRCGDAAKLITEERYFFRLSAFRDRLLALYQYRPAFALPPARAKEVAQLVRHGLNDIPISSRSAHSIPWPDDPEQSVCSAYAAPASYLSAIGFASDDFEVFERFWPANWHVLGREALSAHAIEWPAFLMAADLPLPKHVFAHGSVRLAQEPDGTSLVPEQLLQAVGSDAFRYALLRGVAYGEDAELSFDGVAARNNAELSGGLGALLRRVSTLTARYCDGKIPRRSLLTGLDWTLEIASREILAEARFLFDNLNFSEGLEKIWSLLAVIDNALEGSHAENWSADATRRQELTDWLHDACESLGLAALLLYPVMPRAITALWKSFGQPTLPEEQLFDMTPWGFLRPGTPIADPGELFPVIQKAPAMNL